MAPTVAHRRCNTAVLALAASLAVLLVPARASIVGYTPDMLLEPFRYGTEMLISACYDAAFIAATTTVSLVLLWLAQRWPRTHRALAASLVVCLGLVLLIGLANVKVVAMLDHPFNYQWLCYSEFLLSQEARSAVSQVFSWQVAAVAAGALLSWLLLGAIFALLFRVSRRWFSTRELACMVVPALGVYLLLSHWFLSTQQWNTAKLANPIYWFAESYVSAADMPRLLTMKTAAGAEDFQTVDERRAASGRNAVVLASASAAPRPRNVVLFVLESTSALWLDAFGGPHAVTPELSKYMGRAIAFDSAYANTPASPQSLVALLCSTYPLLTYESLTAVHPDAPLPSLSGTLAQHGYDTAFFSAGSIDFQGVDQFLAHREFNIVSGPGMRPQTGSEFTSEWAYLGGSDESSTVDSLITWIGERPTERPFFAMYWSLQAHYPYFVAGETRRYVEGNDELNRYLTAVQQTDEAFGKLMRHLEQTGELDSTLVVVVGDHGESLGQHGSGKGRRLYEENLRVPLAFIYGPRFSAQRDDEPAAMIDIAPSILDLLGVPLPGAWQGRSLFGDERTGRVYFCAPWSDWLFGCRDGDMKMILSATQGNVEVYDLANDPHETTNIAATSRAFVDEAEERLAAWAQYQRDYYSKLGELPPRLDEQPAEHARPMTVQLE